MTAGEFRLRVCYRKAARLRWLSHLEVVHSLERTVRRAGLPFAVTQGFSPHMKVAFGPALPVGTASDNEYLDLWLREYTDPKSCVELLSSASVADLGPNEAAFVPLGGPSLTSTLAIAAYRLTLEGRELDSENVHAALMRVVSAGLFEIEQKGKLKVFDLTRVIPKDPSVSDGEGHVIVDMALRIGPEGSLRPEALVKAAADQAAIELTAVHTTRLDALIETDEGVWSRPL